MYVRREGEEEGVERAPFHQMGFYQKSENKSDRGNNGEIKEKYQSIFLPPLQLRLCSR